MTEATLQHAIRLAVGALPGVALWRNETGVAQHPGRHGVGHVRYGLCRGSADCIGIVAPHGRLLALEVKSATGRVTPEQARFLALVRSLGGVAGVVRSVADALALVEEARAPNPDVRRFRAFVDAACTDACTCGGDGPGACCPACEVFHAVKRAYALALVEEAR